MMLQFINILKKFEIILYPIIIGFFIVSSTQIVKSNDKCYSTIESIADVLDDSFDGNFIMPKTYTGRKLGLLLDEFVRQDDIVGIGLKHMEVLHSDRIDIISDRESKENAYVIYSKNGCVMDIMDIDPNVLHKIINQSVKHYT